MICGSGWRDGTTAQIALSYLYELFSKVSALQQPKECFWHAFDPLKHVFFETDLSRFVANWRGVDQLANRS
jgi:hypothetical protein